MSDIAKRLRASVRMDAHNGDRMERAICRKQAMEAAAEIDRLSEEVHEVKEERRHLRAAQKNLAKKYNELSAKLAATQRVVESASTALTIARDYLEPFYEMDSAPLHLVVEARGALDAYQEKP